MSSALVSIAIITHNTRRELERCLASIREHAGMPVELIVIDNGSSDDTVAWVKRTYPDAILIESPKNIGEHARELGLRRASCRYVMHLDSDAALTEGALPRMVEALERHPDWGLIGPRLVYDDGSLQHSCRRFPPLLLPFLRRPPLVWFAGDSETVKHHLMYDFDHESTRPVQYMISACHLFRLSLARVAGSYDTKIFWGPSDIDWCIRIRDAGGAVVYFPEATVIHSYQRSTRRLASWLTLRHLFGFYYFQRKYRRRRGELIELERKLDRADRPV